MLAHTAGKLNHTGRYRFDVVLFFLVGKSSDVEMVYKYTRLLSRAPTALSPAIWTARAGQMYARLQVYFRLQSNLGNMLLLPPPSPLRGLRGPPDCSGIPSLCVKRIFCSTKSNRDFLGLNYICSLTYMSQ